ARAALGLSRLPRLDAEIEARRDRVRRYRRDLLDLDGLELLFDEAAVERSSHFAIPVLLADQSKRDGLRAHLGDRGVQTTWYPAVTQLSAYRQAKAFPRAEEAAARHCAL